METSLTLLSGQKEKLTATPLPLVLPIGSEDSFKGHVDLLTMKAHIWDEDAVKSHGAEFKKVDIPSEYLEQAKSARESLIDSLSAYDDEILELALEEKEVPLELLRKAIRKATVENKIVPMLCGSAFKNKGVQDLLDSVAYYLPSPLDKVYDFHH